MKLDIQNIINDINGVVARIGADSVSWSPNFTWDVYDPSGLIDKLDKTGEIEDVELEHIKTATNGTLEFAGRKILVYIRDHTKRNYTNTYRYKPPKFHISDCYALQKARREGRYDRYVVSQKTDGKFRIKRIRSDGSIYERDDEPLKVCKYCLMRLDYKGYSSLPYKQKEIFDKFSINEFFELYKTTSVIPPKYSDITAPTNDYPKEWTAISNNMKQVMNYTCEDCKIELTQNKSFLHVHHKNGRKDNNLRENLQVLCIRCHSKKDSGHAHLVNKPEYKEFMSLYGWRYKH